MSGRRNTPPGPGVDASGQTAIDPTDNVKALSEAANKRQDDLRVEAEKFTNARIDNLQREMEIRAECAKELVNAESRRVDEQAALRAGFAKELSDAEAKRIDAIRAVDVAAVSVASQRASDQAQVLATQVAASAEALRGLVAATATTVAASQQQLSTTLSARITTLEQSSYQLGGKSAGIGSTGAVIAVAASLLIALGSFMFTVFGHSQPAPVYVQPPLVVQPK
jgi:hypothetical protein